MSEVRSVHFNNLPESVRRRLIACIDRSAWPPPILAEPDNKAGASVGWILLALLCLAVLYGTAAAGYGSTYSRNAIHGPGMIALYGLGTLGLVYSVLAAARRMRSSDSLPFKPGRYLFPMDLVDARGPVLRIIPMHTLVNLRPTHRYYNGAYTGTTFEFTFEGGVREVLSMNSLPAAEQALRDLQQGRQVVAEAARNRDLDTLGKLDPFLELRLDGSWDRLGATAWPSPGGGPLVIERPVPVLLRQAGVVALIATVLFAPGMWFLRNRMSDDATLARLERYSSVYSLEAYLRYGGGRHAARVRDELLPAAAFRDAQQRGTVTALRDWVRRYPQSRLAPQARAVIHQRFASVLQTFFSQAANDDPAMPVFMQSLLMFQEAQDSPPVRVRFFPPTTTALANIDALLATRALRRPIAPIGGNFSEARSLPRERTITDDLQGGFAAVFPNDVMALEHAGRLDAASSTAPSTTNATIDVAYVVTPSGQIYTSDGRNRSFIGIEVNFDVTMRVPGVATPYTFHLRVEPPQTFSVRYERSRYAAAGANDHPSDTRVYDVMAERAFDQLSDRLRAVFFRPGTPGYRGSGSDRVRTPTTPRGNGYGSGSGYGSGRGYGGSGSTYPRY